MKNHKKRTRKVEEKSQCRDFSLKLGIKSDEAIDDA
jgi:hypothetical protein